MIEAAKIPGFTHEPWRDDSSTPVMMPLPPGVFLMGTGFNDRFGNDTERPVHAVRIPPGLSVGRYPVTTGEFRQFRSDICSCARDDLPVHSVSWLDAEAYCEWLSRRTKRHYRLLAEAEWEYACRAGTTTLFAFGDSLGLMDANFLYSEGGEPIGPGHPVPVGKFRGNAFGLHDFHGNVCEWVADTWHPSYEGAPSDGRAWVDKTSPRRVVRGGAWDYMPRLLRSAWRDWYLETSQADNLGFRVATNTTPAL